MMILLASFDWLGRWDVSIFCLDFWSLSWSEMNFFYRFRRARDFDLTIFNWGDWFLLLLLFLFFLFLLLLFFLFFFLWCWFFILFLILLFFILFFRLSLSRFLLFLLECWVP